MAISVTEEATGTLSSTGSSTEDTIVEEATAGVFRLLVSWENLLAVNAYVTIRGYSKLASGGAYFLTEGPFVFHGTLLEDGGGGEDPAFVSDPVEVLYGHKWTLADSGASKNYLWLEHEVG